MNEAKIVLTLFENQILRNLIINNNGKLFINLVKNFNVTILTNSDLHAKLIDLLNQLKVQDVTVQVVEDLNQNFFSKLLAVFAKNMNASSSNSWSNNRNYALGNYSLFGLMIRKIINKLFAKRKSFHGILRFIMKHLTFHHQLNLNETLDRCELVVLTSTTNFKWDVKIGQIASRKKKKLVAIPRSWDNFTSHGALRIKPDKIFSFSPEMSKHLIKYHFINESKIIEIKNPAYDNIDHVLRLKRSEVPQNKKILYACMGSYLFEQESIFINDLSKILSLAGYDLEILKHPKFETDFSEDINSTIISYEKYSNQNLLQEYLSTFRLVLTAGSSIALDCYHYNVKFFCVFIETLPIDSSRSVNRYFDSVEHFTEFIALNKVKVLTSYDQLAKQLTTLDHGKFETDYVTAEVCETTPMISEELVRTIYSMLEI